ncbi:MAG: S8 family serine peptidase [Actinomycetota bacterium]
MTPSQRAVRATLHLGTASLVVVSALGTEAHASVSPTREGGPLVSSIVIDRVDGRAPSTEYVIDRIDLDGAIVDSVGGGYDVIRLATPVSRDEAESIAAEIEKTGLVEAADPDGVRFSAAANDPRYADQWYLPASGPGIGVEQAWSLTTGSPDLVIAVIDTGRLDHPDLTNRLVEGYDFVFRTRDSKDGDGWDADETDLGDWSDVADPTYSCSTSSGFQPSSWHGTHISGIIGASTNNGIGVAGINQRSRIQHLRVLGTCGGRTSDEATAIRWAAGLPVPGVPNNPTPARVINLSLGSASACEAIEQDAINAATAAGAVVVVAAGNSGQNLATTNFAPASCDNVITATAVRNDGTRASYANYGPPVDVAAPGGPTGILSTMNAGTRSVDLSTSGWTYGYKQGTSMSTPIVTGIVSLMLSVNPSLDSSQVEAILKQTTRPFAGGGSSCSSTAGDVFYCGAGLVDAAAAVALAANTSSDATVTRFEQSANDDIFATNLAIEQAADRTDIVLTSGSVYADGMAAAALAKQQNADIMLVPPTGLTATQITAIVNEAPQKIWIMGGPQAIPASIEAQLTSSTSQGGAGLSSANIERLFGATRYETATAVAGRLTTVGTINGKRTAFIVRGDSFADAVIAGPATFGPADSADAFPILLVQRDRLPDSVKSSLQGLGITNVLIVGGTSVVSDTTKKQIEALGVTTFRIAGADRYGTATALANFLSAPASIGGFGWSAANVGLVNISDQSNGFDAISATGVLGPNRRVLLGATASQVPAATVAWLSQLNGAIRAVTVVGSQTSLPPAVVSQATSLLRR